MRVHPDAFDRRQTISQPVADLVAGRMTVGPMRDHEHVDVKEEHGAASGSERRSVVTQDVGQALLVQEVHSRPQSGNPRLEGG